MHISGWFIGTFVAIGMIVIAVIRCMIKQNILKDREPISLIQMYQKETNRIDVCFEIFEKVFKIVGQAYRVDPRMLRSYDKLKMLYDLDSWDLGEGTEELNKQIREKFDITRFEVEPKTIIELVVEIGKQMKNKANRGSH